MGNDGITPVHFKQVTKSYIYNIRFESALNGWHVVPQRREPGVPRRDNGEVSLERVVLVATNTRWPREVKRQTWGLLTQHKIHPGARAMNWLAKDG
jgi:hypothetical protein